MLGVANHSFKRVSFFFKNFELACGVSFLYKFVLNDNSINDCFFSFLKINFQRIFIISTDFLVFVIKKGFNSFATGDFIYPCTP